jgi:hypothetical protein
MNRMLAVLVDEIREPRWHQNAWKLVHPLIQDFGGTSVAIFLEFRMPERAVKFCCRLLEEDSSTKGKNQVQSNSIPILIRLVAYRRAMYKTVPLPHTQAQFDLLVDHHVRICENTDYDAIWDTLTVLEWLGGSPSTPGRLGRYIDTTMGFMGLEITRGAALRAACAIRLAVASMGRDYVSLREDFSKAFASAVLSDAAQTPLDDNPTFSFFYSHRDTRPYLSLLCTLFQEPIWHPQLHQNGHFDNCLAIAKALSSQEDDDFDEYAVPLAHIFAIIDVSGEEHPWFSPVQAYLTWQFVLRAWRCIFRLAFFGGELKYTDPFHFTTDCIEALPSLVAYARKRCDDKEGRIIALVEQVCRKLDEEKQQCQHDDSQHIRDDISFGHRGIPALGKQIYELLDASQRDA